MHESSVVLGILDSAGIVYSYYVELHTTDACACKHSSFRVLILSSLTIVCNKYYSDHYAASAVSILSMNTIIIVL